MFEFGWFTKHKKWKKSNFFVELHFKIERK